MKKHVLFSAFILGSTVLFAQPITQNSVNEMNQKVEVSKPSSFAISVPLTELITNLNDDYSEKKEVHQPNRKLHSVVNANALPKGTDPAKQSQMGSTPNRAPIVTFNGLNGQGYPPDPSGAAGNGNFYVQAVNCQYSIYNKTGALVLGPLSLSSLWTGSANNGDPIVMYDKYADRWFISQFQTSSPYKILIAISETNDPTGKYYTYSYTMSEFPDYPKFSIWTDGYYMTLNSNQNAVVFERTEMIAGNPSARMIALTAPSIFTGGFTSVLPADADGYLPPANTPCYFFNIEDDAFGAPQDQLKIFKMTTDWVNTANTKIDLSQTLAVQPVDLHFDGGYKNIPQKGTAQMLDAVQEILMYRAQYRKWVGYNTVVLSHVTDVGTNNAAVRWYELRDANNGVFSIYQQGTYAPDSQHRFMSSAAMDNQGNIAMGYTISSSSTYPSLAYTGQMKGDALGQMTLVETIAQAGEGSQTSSERYGDYSQLCLDPTDDQTFWFTSEYFNASGNPQTKIISFKISTTTVGTENIRYKNIAATMIQENAQLKVNVNGLHDNSTLLFEVYTMNGKLLYTSNVSPSNNQFSHEVNVGNYASGTYLIRYGNSNFQKVEKIVLN